MANYYNFIIKSDKITQEVAADIFTQASAHNKITYFEFREGRIFMYSRGVPDVADVLEKYNHLREIDPRNIDAFFELFEVKSKEYVVATFLAILEMAKEKELII